MADILIHRCTLRVIRRGGWSWGPDPKCLVQDVVQILPVLLAQKLAELLVSEENAELGAPLRVLLRLRMSELTSDSDATRVSAISAIPQASVSLEARVDLALRAALGLPAPPPLTEPIARTRPGPVSRFAKKSPSHSPHQGGALEHLLLTWQAEGSLQRRLAVLPSSEIELWHARVMSDSQQSAFTFASPTGGLRDQVEAIARIVISALGFSDRASSLAFRLLIAVTVAAELRISVSNPILWQVIDDLIPPGKACAHYAPLMHDASAENPLNRAQAQPNFNITETSLVTDSASIIDSRNAESSDWDVRIGCALPFLLLGPLAQIGYLSTLAAVLETIGMEEDASLFAVALAHKVLDRPERGWNRTPASRLAASVFAGFPEGLNEEMLVSFSRDIGKHVGALDLTLADALIVGHAVNSPVLLCRADLPGSKSWMLVDSSGCFPIACCDALEDILPLWDRLGRPIVLVSEDAADATLFAALDAAEVDFITKLPPTRKDRWRRIQQGPSTLGWTNSESGDLEILQRAAQELDTATEECQMLWESFAISRPGVIRTGSLQFERSLILAAAVAMGTISWQIWQTHGRTTPQQTLEAYHDLDALVSFRSESVVVRLPLGRRRSSLYNAGLLAPIGDIPWLGNRRVEYEGG